MQIIEQTLKQKMAMYMKLPKKKIIEMLIECNRVLETRIPYLSDNQFTLTNPPPHTPEHLPSKPK